MCWAEARSPGLEEGGGTCAEADQMWAHLHLLPSYSPRGTKGSIKSRILKGEGRKLQEAWEGKVVCSLGNKTLPGKIPLLPYLDGAWSHNLMTLGH